jgi:hypothetical protein
MLYEILKFAGPAIILNIFLNLFGFFKNYFSLEKLDLPVDLHKKFYDGRRILGESTTYGGLVIVLIFGLVISLFLNDYYELLKAILVYIAHTLGSFIKRRLGKKDGEYVPILNHGDYIVLISLVFIFLNKIDFIIGIFSIIFILIITPLLTISSYYLGIRKNIL